MRLPSKKILLIVVGIILLIGIVVSAYYFFFTDKTPPDTTPPELQLTSPTADEWYSTNQDKISIEGLAVDASGVESISWKTDYGDIGSTKVADDSWTITTVPLAEGDNKITIKATDTKGNASEAILNAVYNPDILFYDITLSQDYIYKGDLSSKITARAGVETKSKKGIGDVYLYRISGDHKEKLTKMSDNGNTANGDDIPSDSVFSGIESLSATSSEAILLRVGATLDNSDKISYSGVLQITVLVKPTPEQVSKIFSLNEEINNKFEEIKQSKPGQEAAEELVNYLSEKDKIETAGISENGYGVWWKFKETGILGGVQNNPEGTRGESNQPDINQKVRKQREQNQEQIKGLSWTKPATPPIRFGPSKVYAQASKRLEVKSTKAIYLGPYLHDFGNTDDYHDAWETIKNSKCPKCQTVEKKDADVTVEDFKTLSNYGLVVVVSHGDSWFKGAFGTNKGQVITYTYQKIDFMDYLKYLPDLLMNRLALDSTNTLVVLPSFISRYNGTFPDSLVYIGTCRSTYNFSMASAYLSKGAKAYYGFNGYVLSQYAKDVAGEMTKRFVNKGTSARESFNNAVATKGASDGSGSFFNFWGWSNLKIGGKEVQNASFEDGLVGWQAEGDSRVINQLAALKPQDGNRIAIISTGLGSINDSNSALIQKICSQEGTAVLSFKYDFISEEPMEYVNSAFDDNFTMVVSINNKKTIIIQKTINNSKWKKIDGIDFAGGDTTTYHTGWKKVSKNLGKIKATDLIQIEFRVSDKGDSYFDSAALIDAVKLEVK